MTHQLLDVFRCIYSFELDYNHYVFPMMDGFIPVEAYYRHLEETFSITVPGAPFSDLFDPSFNEPMVFKGENLRIAVANLGGIDYVEWECDGVRQIASIDTVDGSRSLLVYCYGTGLVAPGLHKVSIIVNTDDTDGLPSKSGSFDLQLLMRG